jgi:predicted HD phosphohydrolase
VNVRTCASSLVATKDLVIAAPLHDIGKLVRHDTISQFTVYIKKCVLVSQL